MYYTKTSNGIEVAKRDIIDDLKDVINRYEFYQDEVRRCYHDMEEYEAKIKHGKIYDILRFGVDRLESGMHIRKRLRCQK